MNHILNIHPNGNITTLWTDAIPLQEIGHLTINRASTIEFNGTKQEWEVRFSDSTTPVFSHKSRAACVAWEIETLNGKV